MELSTTILLFVKYSDEYHSGYFSIVIIDGNGQGLVTVPET